MTGLRELKKSRTREALFNAALRLFEEKGYTATTVAEIAAAAGVSTKTLFNHFAGKEDILFAHRSNRESFLLERFAEYAAGEPAGVALTRSFEDLLAALAQDRPEVELGAAEARLILSVPELRSRMLVALLDLQRSLTAALHDAYGDRVDLVTAASAVGSLIGAVQTAGVFALDRGVPADEVLATARRAVAFVAPGLHGLDGLDP